MPDNFKDQRSRSCTATQCPSGPELGRTMAVQESFESGSTLMPGAWRLGGSTSGDFDGSASSTQPNDTQKLHALLKQVAASLQPCKGLDLHATRRFKWPSPPCSPKAWTSSIDLPSAGKPTSLAASPIGSQGLSSPKGPGCCFRAGNS